MLDQDFPGSSDGKASACNEGDLDLISGLGRSPGEGKGYPLQYSGLESSMDYTVLGVAELDMTDFHFHFHPPIHPSLSTLSRRWTSYGKCLIGDLVNFVKEQTQSRACPRVDLAKATPREQSYWWLSGNQEKSLSLLQAVENQFRRIQTLLRFRQVARSHLPEPQCLHL